MSDVNIRAGLLQGVIDANVGYPIKWPNKSFETPANSPWVRATILSAGDDPVTLGSGGYNERTGLMQIDIFTPKNSGDLTATAATDTVKAIFKTGAKLTHNGQTVRINSAATRTGTDEQEWFSRIIDVDFTSYETR